MHKYKYRITIRVTEDGAISRIGEIHANNKELAYQEIKDKYNLQLYPRQNVSVNITKA